MKRSCTISLFSILIILAISITAFAHSGRTDSSGGHKDNKNSSGLGSYHYHHGYGPHLHSDGVCPYNTSSSTPEPTSTPVVTPEITTLTATPTASAVLVNGNSVAFDAYTIDGNNYFKIRDLAYILSSSEKQFEVTWDSANNAIGLISGQPYTAVGGEMARMDSGAKTPIPTSSKILLDGSEVTFSAYSIDNNNYFKLRDIGETFDFNVSWDGENNTIVIDTSASYTAN